MEKLFRIELSRATKGFNVQQTGECCCVPESRRDPDQVKGAFSGDVKSTKRLLSQSRTQKWVIPSVSLDETVRELGENET